MIYTRIISQFKLQINLYPDRMSFQNLTRYLTTIISYFMFKHINYKNLLKSVVNGKPQINYRPTLSLVF